MFVYVGTYTKPQGRAEGIYVYRFDPTSGALAHVQTVSGIANPSFLTTDSAQRVLYSVNEDDGGAVSAFARDGESGELRLLNTQSSHGASSCYISLDPTDRYVLTANYNGGSATVLPIAEDGRVEPASYVLRHEGSGPNARRQEGPHPHMIASTPDGRMILVTDLGTDSVMTYRLSGGRLVPGEHPSAKAPHPGAGPRHFAFAPDGRTVYVLNELDSTVTVYAYDPDTGALQAGQTVSALPDSFQGENTCAQIVVAPDGRYVYGSNRGHDSIAIWAVDETSGELQPARHVPSGGETPRNFNIDPTGSWLLAANQESDTIVTFRRDPESGSLSPAGQVAPAPSPVCVIFCRP